MLKRPVHSHEPSRSHEKDNMITLTTPSPRTNRAAVAVGLGAAAAVGAVGLGIFGVPTAAASPAPSSVEADYIDTLDASGMHIVGQDADELKLGYPDPCALSQQNEIPPADAAAIYDRREDLKTLLLRFE